MTDLPLERIERIRDVPEQAEAHEVRYVAQELLHNTAILHLRNVTNRRITSHNIYLDIALFAITKKFRNYRLNANLYWFIWYAASMSYFTWQGMQ